MLGLFGYAAFALAVAFAAQCEEKAGTVTIKSPEDYASTPFAAWRIPAGTKLLTHIPAKGKALHTLEFPGGVTMEENESGSLMGSDHSGKGAVMCTWMIYASIKGEFDACHTEEKEWRSQLDIAAEKMENFILANSLTPVTKESLVKNLDQERQKAARRCGRTKEDFAQSFITKKADILPKFQLGIDEMLAVARPPVTNPCL